MTEKWFCVDCGDEVKDEGTQWHTDVGHKLVPRNQVTTYDNKPKEKDERTASKKCYDFAMTKIKKLVISENNSDEVYAIVQVNGHTEAINLSSARAKHWLSDEYSKNVESNEIHADDFFKTVLNHIIAKAQMNGTERVHIHQRVAQVDGAIYYDLGTPDWQIIKITAAKIETVKFDIACPVFRRSQSMQRQVMPESGDDKALDRLVDLLRILPKDRLVFKVHLITMFLEAYPIPLMVFDGMAGSLKTTATATVKRIVDPSGIANEDNVSAMAEKQDDLILQLQNRYLPSFDNVSSISPKTSDILCRAITGSNNPRRKLYTDDEESIHSFKRKIVLNGIIPYLDYPDLQTRLVNYSREIVDESNRMTEQEFRQKLDELLPSALGQIFITLCKALRKYPDIKDQIRPRTRMSDFEVWGETISQVSGNLENEFLQRYYEKINEGNISSQDSYPIVGAIQSFMIERESWEGMAANLYHHLVTTAQNQDIDLQSKFVRFPKSPNKLTKELVIVQPLLKSIGFSVEMYRYTKNDGKFMKNTSIVRISRKEYQSPLFPGVSPLPPPSPPTPDLGTKTGGDTGGDTGPEKHVSPPEKAEFTHENAAGGDSGDGGGSPGKAPGWFTCETHKAGPFPVDAVSKSSGSILEFHRNLGCQIRYMDGEDVQL
ncbi:MAG TPA: hypothetical protein VNL34_04930 [Candidatus Nitrosotenuis sp.]|nr:hypothetical protein [Candidatus Nitrosotenuis sp.]